MGKHLVSVALLMWPVRLMALRLLNDVMAQWSGSGRDGRLRIPDRVGLLVMFKSGTWESQRIHHWSITAKSLVMWPVRRTALELLNGPIAQEGTMEWKMGKDGTPSEVMSEDSQG